MYIVQHNVAENHLLFKLKTTKSDKLVPTLYFDKYNTKIIL